MSYPEGFTRADRMAIDAPSKTAALSRAKRLRKADKLACAFERRNIRYPEEAPPGLDLPANLYDRDDISLEPNHGE